MDYPVGVCVIKPDQNLQNVTLDIFKSKIWPQSTEICVFNILKDQRRGLGAWVSHFIHKIDNKGTPLQSFQNFDLPPDFYFLYRLQNFDDNIFILNKVNASEDFRVPPSTQFHSELIVILGSKNDFWIFIVTILFIHLSAHICIKFWRRDDFR